MMPRRFIGKRRGALSVGVSALLGFAMLFAVACGTSTSAAPTTPTASPTPSSGVLGAQITPPMPMPNVVLTDTSGKPFSLKQDTAGDLTLVYLGYTHCPDVCPTTMANFAAAFKLLPASITSHVKMIFVTTDPARDTPTVIRQWLDHFDTQFIGLTGTQAQLDQLQQDLGIPPAQKEATGTADYGVSHAAFTFAFTPNDQVAHTIYPEGFTKEDLAHDISILVNGWKGPTG